MTDAEILDEVERLIDMMQQEFYESRSNDAKRIEASFYMGMIAGTVMRRVKP